MENFATEDIDRIEYILKDNIRGITVHKTMPQI